MARERQGGSLANGKENTAGPMEIRRPKPETRKKAETRNPKAEVTELDVLLASLNRGDFGFRTSDFIRP